MAGGLGVQSSDGARHEAPPMVTPRKTVSVRVPFPNGAELRCLSPLGRVIKVSKDHAQQDTRARLMGKEGKKNKNAVSFFLKRNVLA